MNYFHSFQHIAVTLGSVDVSGIVFSGSFQSLQSNMPLDMLSKRRSHQDPQTCTVCSMCWVARRGGKSGDGS